MEKRGVRDNCVDMVASLWSLWMRHSRNFPILYCLYHRDLGGIPKVLHDIMLCLLDLPESDFTILHSIPPCAHCPQILSGLPGSRLATLVLIQKPEDCNKWCLA